MQWLCRSIEGYFTNRIICIFSIVGSTFNTQQRLSTTCCLAVAGNNAQNTCALCSLLALGSFTQHEVCVNPLLSCRALLSLVPSFLDAPRQQGLRKMNATTENLLKNRCLYISAMKTAFYKQRGRETYLTFIPSIL